MKKEYVERILLILDKLRTDERLIVVERSTDRVSLEKLGISPERIVEVSKKAIFELEEIFEERKASSVISFLDGDRAGRALLKKMKSLFQHIEFDESYSSYLYATLRVSFAADLAEAIERMITSHHYLFPPPR